MSFVDLTGTSDEVSAAALPPVNPICASRTEQWAREGAAVIARHPGSVLAAAVVAGFLVGRMVKRLLFSRNGRE